MGKVVILYTDEYNVKDCKENVFIAIPLPKINVVVILKFGISFKFIHSLNILDILVTDVVVNNGTDWRE
jgi:hypothetical protein